MAKAKPIQHPYPCDYHPVFRTQHDAYVFVETFQEQGYIKHCSHLSVRYFENPLGGSKYGPACEERSFKTEEGPYRGYLFHGCPKDCRLYEPAWQGRAKGLLRATYRSVKRGVAGFGNWILELVRAVFGSAK